MSYIAVASLINAVVDYLPFVPAPFSLWVSRVITAAMIFCMFSLSGINIRYWKAGLFRALYLGCGLVTSFLLGSYLLSIAATLFSFVAVYQEYSAHSEIVASKDSDLSRNWYKLFYWEIAAALLLSLGSTIATVLLMSAKLPIAVSEISAMVTLFLKNPRFILQILRLVYLEKTIVCFSSEEERLNLNS